MRRWACAGTLVLAMAACTGDSDDELCVSGHTPEESQAIEEELILMAHSLATGASEEIQSITDEVDAQYIERRPPTIRGCANLKLSERYLLTVEYLVAYPELVSPELLAGLRDAATPSHEGVMAGLNGVYGFLLNDRLHEPDYPGLHELRAWVREGWAARKDLADELSELED